eukprot:gnl/Chilomastix_cuspidata/5499.p1 GENE.gnl/Chilomastix_cuspidata/5499~~gnl/Chilomastix_cuspidata/5499.p1  ORF type:complete len:1773 (+),score=274.29 gnl/Chilomastix_cuspidata/5499:36-5354(+)
MGPQVDDDSWAVLAARSDALREGGCLSSDISELFEEFKKTHGSDKTTLLRKARTIDATDAFNARIPTQLRFCIWLEFLFLGFNRLVSIESLPPLPALIKLDLQNNAIYRLASASVFSALPRLTFLYLHSNKLRNYEALGSLAALRNLRVLTLWGNPVALQPDYRPRLLELLPGLLVLDDYFISEAERYQLVDDPFPNVSWGTYLVPLSPNLRFTHAESSVPRFPPNAQKRAEVGKCPYPFADIGTVLRAARTDAERLHEHERTNCPVALIQRVWRGCIARAFAKDFRSVLERGARTVQRVWRGFAARRQMDFEVKLQSLRYWLAARKIERFVSQTLFSRGRNTLQIVKFKKCRSKRIIVGACKAYLDGLPSAPKRLHGAYTFHAFNRRAAPTQNSVSVLPGQSELCLRLIANIIFQTLRQLYGPEVVTDVDPHLEGALSTALGHAKAQGLSLETGVSIENIEPASVMKVMTKSLNLQFIAGSTTSSQTKRAEDQEDSASEDVYTEPTTELQIPLVYGLILRERWTHRVAATISRAAFISDTTGATHQHVSVGRCLLKRLAPRNPWPQRTLMNHEKNSHWSRGIENPKLAELHTSHARSPFPFLRSVTFPSSVSLVLVYLLSSPLDPILQPAPRELEQGRRYFEMLTPSVKSQIYRILENPYIEDFGSEVARLKINLGHIKAASGPEFAPPGNIDLAAREMDDSLQPILMIPSCAVYRIAAAVTIQAFARRCKARAESRSLLASYFRLPTQYGLQTLVYISRAAKLIQRWYRARLARYIALSRVMAHSVAQDVAKSGHFFVSHKLIVALSAWAQTGAWETQAPPGSFVINGSNTGTEALRLLWAGHEYGPARRTIAHTKEEDLARFAADPDEAEHRRKLAHIRQVWAPSIPPHFQIEPIQADPAFHPELRQNHRRNLLIIAQRRGTVPSEVIEQPRKTNSSFWDVPYEMVSDPIDRPALYEFARTSSFHGVFLSTQGDSVPALLYRILFFGTKIEEEPTPGSKRCRNVLFKQTTTSTNQHIALRTGGLYRVTSLHGAIDSAKRAGLLASIMFIPHRVDFSVDGEPVGTRGYTTAPLGSHAPLWEGTQPTPYFASQIFRFLRPGERPSTQRVARVTPSSSKKNKCGLCLSVSDAHSSYSFRTAVSTQLVFQADLLHVTSPGLILIYDAAVTVQRFARGVIAVRSIGRARAYRQLLKPWPYRRQQGARRVRILSAADRLEKGGDWITKRYAIGQFGHGASKRKGPTHAETMPDGALRVTTSQISIIVKNSMVTRPKPTITIPRPHSVKHTPLVSKLFDHTTEYQYASDILPPSVGDKDARVTTPPLPSESAERFAVPRIQQTPPRNALTALAQLHGETTTSAAHRSEATSPSASTGGVTEVPADTPGIGSARRPRTKALSVNASPRYEPSPSPRFDFGQFDFVEGAGATAGSLNSVAFGALGSAPLPVHVSRDVPSRYAQIRFQGEEFARNAAKVSQIRRDAQAAKEGVERARRAAEPHVVLRALDKIYKHSGNERPRSGGASAGPIISQPMSREDKRRVFVSSATLTARGEGTDALPECAERRLGELYVRAEQSIDDLARSRARHAERARVFKAFEQRQDAEFLTQSLANWKETEAKIQKVQQMQREERERRAERKGSGARKKGVGARLLSVSRGQAARIGWRATHAESRAVVAQRTYERREGAARVGRLRESRREGRASFVASNHTLDALAYSARRDELEGRQRLVKESREGHGGRLKAAPNAPRSSPSETRRLVTPANSSFMNSSLITLPPI